MLRLVSISLVAGTLLAAAPVAAQESAPIGNQFCNKDLQPMIDRRTKIATNLQAINKRGRPKTFEQAKKTFNEFCGSLSSYIENDKKMLDYMQSNKEFCSITDENIKQITADLTQTQKTKAKICSHPPRQQVAPQPGRGGGGPAAPKPPVNLRLQ
ncbi:hypothetical protein J8I29_11910 [Labrys sp. LIt4]|uniref:Uncharacterized protein n=1 Tax=Labrys okinawensis TaxID=346911 RepID=A0A2S9QDU4_9HYPH|nr:MULTISPECIES: hypothetical protein [Labrys]MBP0580016.1 hypothetical protein [Labrys sp. LIt4]PRH87523.1 hypothetical protein C5L14_13015 [Labrys okinawensis]